MPRLEAPVLGTFSPSTVPRRSQGSATLGHCHDRRSGTKPFVNFMSQPGATTPQVWPARLRGSWAACRSR
jgi:hypothetical protein